MSITMSASPNRPPPEPNNFETGTNRTTVATNRFTHFDDTQPPDQTPNQYSQSLGNNDLFFDSSSSQSQTQPSHESLVDSFTLFSTSDSPSDEGHSASASVTSQLFNPIVFNQQFSQFQQATNSSKYFSSSSSYQRRPFHHSTEITEANVDDEEEEINEKLTGPRGQIFVQGIEEEADQNNRSSDNSAVDSNGQSLYESYIIDYDADYEQYYDPNNVHYHQSQSRHSQHYTVEEEDEEEEGLEYFSGPGNGHSGVIGTDNDVNLDMVDDAKTYGLMLPPYHHLKQMPNNQQQQLHPQFQMIQHPYIYGNPFSYNLHTIVEESENESSLQTLSSVTSSNFQSLTFDQHQMNTTGSSDSQTPTNDSRSKRQTSQIGELFDQSLSPHCSPPSSHESSMKSIFLTGKMAKSHQHSHHHSQLDSHPRSSAENFSEISFTSSSSFSENGSEPEERSDEEEDETFHVVTANTNLTELIAEDLQNTATEPDQTTSKLERYFTSSLLEANNTSTSKHIIPKIEPQPMSLTPTTSLPLVHTFNSTAKENSNVEQTKPKLTRQQAMIKYKLVKLKYALRRLLLDASFCQLTLDQIHQLNIEFFRSDWIALLKAIIDKNLQQRAVVPPLLTKIYYVFRLQFTSSKLKQHIVDYLVNHMLSTSAVHIVRSHQMAGKVILLTANNKKILMEKVLSFQNKSNVIQSQIQITINQGQSMITIKNESTVNSNAKKFPAAPFRIKKEIKLQTIQSKRLSKVDSLDDHKMIYRTVLQVNDVNGTPYQSEFSNINEKIENKRISKLLNQSNPLNRNFLVKSMLSDNAESEEKSKQHSEIYGWIQRAPSKTEQMYTTVGNESERSQKSKPHKSKLLNSSTQLLLGSLRSRSKDRSNWNDSESTAKHDKNSGKFKTISGNVHSKSATTTDDGQKNPDTKFKLERSQKGSKSFRDTRSTTTAAATTTTSNQTTWDAIYGGGIKLLKNISFVRNRNRSSAAKERPHYESVQRSVSESSELEESLDQEPSSSPNKSFSEPNLHKTNNGCSRTKAIKESSDNIYETLKPPVEQQQLSTVVSGSKSTPHLTTGQSKSQSRIAKEINQSSNDELNETTTATKATPVINSATMSTPSLLYRLSNPVPSNSGNGSSMNLRSISTSSLRTRRTKHDSHSTGQYYYEPSSTTHNGEWQKMSTTTKNEGFIKQGPSVWARKPSSLRVISSSETSAVNFRHNTNKVITSSHYQEIFEHVNIEQTELEKPKSAPATSLVKTVTTESLASSQVIGELSIAVNYEMRIGTLEILISKVRIDSLRQKADLYVKVYLLPDRNKSNKRKTRIVKAYRSTTGRSPAGQLHAEFNETLRFTGPFGEFTGRRIWLSVWNNDKFGRNEPIAEMILGPLDSSILSSGQLGTITWFRLVEPISTNPKPTQTSETYIPVESICEIQCHSVSQEKLDFEYTGTIFLAVKYQNDAELTSNADYKQSFNFGSLHILIKEAQNLQFNISTPNVIGITFCRLVLLPERTKQDREKSAAIKCPLEYSSNPRWNQTFVFSNIAATGLQHRSLEITIWFQSEHAMQKSGKKVFVGGVRLSTSISESTSDEISLWNQLLERHNMWAYGEIPLRQIDNAK